jgi:hypothetical protein
MSPHSFLLVRQYIGWPLLTILPRFACADCGGQRAELYLSSWTPNQGGCWGAGSHPDPAHLEAQADAARFSTSTRGCRAAIRSNARAGPSGVLRSGSRFRSVCTLVPRTAANCCCVNGRVAALGCEVLVEAAGVEPASENGETPASTGLAHSFGSHRRDPEWQGSLRPAR